MDENIIDVKDLSLNESAFIDDDVALMKQNGEFKKWPRTPFPINDTINEKVVIHRGDISHLRADAFVNPTNESLTQLNSIIHLAGPELEKFIKKRLYQCATGGVKVTPGFKSNFTYILHAVPPKYQPKYKTAAETALFHTYFRLLETLMSRKIRTVVMPTLSTVKSNLPFEDNFRMQLRVIRRMLEKKSNYFDKIIIPLQENELFAIPFFCYFPRSKVDEEIACYKLEDSVGGPNGEPMIPGREIRIKGKPAAITSDASVDLTSGLDLSTVVGRTAFSKMRADLDKSPMPGSAGCKPSSNQLAVRRNVFRGCTLL